MPDIANDGSSRSLPTPADEDVSADRVPGSVITLPQIRLDIPQLLVIPGAFLLLIGVFTPIFSVPVVGWVTYFQRGKIEGSALLLLAAASATLVILRYHRWLWVTGLASLMLVTFALVRSLRGISLARARIEADAVDEPFAKLGNKIQQTLLENVQMQWGWSLLLIGVILVGAGAVLAEKKRGLAFNRLALAVSSFPAAALLIGILAWALPVGQDQIVAAPKQQKLPPQPFVANVGEPDEPGQQLVVPQKKSLAEKKSALPPEDDGKWAEAGKEAVINGDTKVSVTGVRIGKIEVKDGFSNRPRYSEKDLLQINLLVQNTSKTKILNIRSWGDASFSFSDRVALLRDNFGNDYRPGSFGLFNPPVGQIKGAASIYPGKTTTDVLVFNPPVDGAEYLRLTLPASHFSGKGQLKFQIPASLIHK